MLSDDVEIQAVPGLGRQWSLDVLWWCSIGGSDCPVKRAGVAIARNRLGRQDCEMLMDIMVMVQADLI